MKKLMVGLLIIGVAKLTFASPKYQNEMQDYLRQGSKTSFHFKENTVQTMAYLLESEKKVKVIIDSNIDRKQHFSINLKDQNFLAYLEMTTQKLGLRYEVIDSRKIRVYK